MRKAGLGGCCCVNLWLDSEMESCLLAALTVPVGCPQTVQCGAVVVSVGEHLSHQPTLCSPLAPLMTPLWGLCEAVVTFLHRPSVLAFC